MKDKYLALSVLLNVLFVSFFIGKKVYFLYFVQAPVDNIFTSPYYLVKSELYRNLPRDSGEVVFLGDSQTDFFELSEFFGKRKIKNRAISGEYTGGQLKRLGEITKSHPSKVFIEIGVNDILNEVPVDTIYLNYEKIIASIQEKSPGCKIYIQSILPTGLKTCCNRNNALEIIDSVNKRIEKICLNRKVNYIDLYSQYVRDRAFNGWYFCDDQLHLNVRGYTLWKRIIEKYL
jgi:lysophospholipase L1-like esterase